MDQSDEPRELERKIEQATRIASRLNDQTTVERLRAWIEDLKQRLRQRLEARRTTQAISARAHELWEQNGRPSALLQRMLDKIDTLCAERDRLKAELPRPKGQECSEGGSGEAPFHDDPRPAALSSRRWPRSAT